MMSGNTARLIFTFFLLQAFQFILTSSNIHLLSDGGDIHVDYLDYYLHNKSLTVTCGNGIISLDSKLLEIERNITLLEQGDLSNHLDEYNKLITLKSRYHNARLNWDDVLKNISNEEWTVVLRLLLSVNMLLEDFVISKCYHAEVLLRLNDVERSLTGFKEILLLDPNHLISYLKIGHLLLNVGKFREAEVYYRNLLLIDDTISIAHKGLATSLDAQLHAINKFSLMDDSNNDAEDQLLEETLHHYLTSLQLNHENQPSIHNNAYILTRVGTLLAEKEEWDAAAKYLNQAVKLWPDSQQAHYRLACVLQARGEILFEYKNKGDTSEADRLMTEAIAHYQQATWLNARDFKSQYKLALLLSNLDRVEDAVSHFQIALEIQPKNVELLVQVGATLARNGKALQAIDMYQRAILLNREARRGSAILASSYLSFREEAKTVHRLSALLISENKPLEALRHYQQLLSLLATTKYLSAHDYMGLGSCYHLTQRYDKAIEVYSTALDYHSSVASDVYAPGHVALALAYDAKLKTAKPTDPTKEWQQFRLYHYRTSIREEPHDLELGITVLRDNTLLNGDEGNIMLFLRLNLAQILLEAKEYDMVAVHLGEAVKQWPNSLKAQLRLGQLLSIKGAIAESLPFYQQASWLDASCLECFIGLGEAFLHVNKVHRALDAFTVALKLQPMHIMANHRMGDIMMKIDKFDVAIQSYMSTLKAIDQDINEIYLADKDLQTRDIAVIQNNIAVAYFHSNNHDKALTWFNNVLKIDADNAIAHNNLAHILKLKNKHAMALHHQRQADRLLSSIASKQESEEIKEEIIKARLGDVEKKMNESTIVPPITGAEWSWSNVVMDTLKLFGSIIAPETSFNTSATAVPDGKKLKDIDSVIDLKLKSKEEIMLTASTSDDSSHSATAFHVPLSRSSDSAEQSMAEVTDSSQHDCLLADHKQVDEQTLLDISVQDLHIAATLLESHRFEPALECLSVIDQMGVESHRATSILYRVYASLHTRKLEQALVQVEELLNVVGESENKMERYVALLAHSKLLRLSVGDSTAAYSSLMQAISLFPKYPASQQHLGRLLFDRGLFHEAVQPLTTTLQSLPSTADAALPAIATLHLLARCMYKLNNQKESLNYFDSANDLLTQIVLLEDNTTTSFSSTRDNWSNTDVFHQDPIFAYFAGYLSMTPPIKSLHQLQNVILTQIGQLHKSMQNIQLAANTFMTAISQKKQLQKKKVDLTTTYFEFADLLEADSQYNMALILYNQSVYGDKSSFYDAEDRVFDGFLSPLVRYRLANALYNRNLLSESLVEYVITLHLMTSQGISQHALELYHRIIDLFKSFGQLREAQTYCKSLLDHMEVLEMNISAVQQSYFDIVRERATADDAHHYIVQAQELLGKRQYTMAAQKAQLAIQLCSPAAKPLILYEAARLFEEIHMNAKNIPIVKDFRSFYQQSISHRPAQPRAVLHYAALLTSNSTTDPNEVCDLYGLLLNRFEYFSAPSSETETLQKAILTELNTFKLIDSFHPCNGDECFVDVPVSNHSAQVKSVIQLKRNLTESLGIVNLRSEVHLQIARIRMKQGLWSLTVLHYSSMLLSSDDVMLMQHFGLAHALVQLASSESMKLHNENLVGNLVSHHHVDEWYIRAISNLNYVVKAVHSSQHISPVNRMVAAMSNFLAGKVLLYHNNSMAALDYFKQAVSESPVDLPCANAYYGYTLLLLYKYHEDAEKHYELAITSMEGLNQRIVQLDGYSDSIEMDILLEMAGYIDVYVLNKYAMLQQSKRRFVDAAAVYERSLSIKLNYTSTFSKFIVTNITYQSIADLNDNYTLSNLFHSQATALFYDKRYESAIPLFNKAVEFNPLNGRALNNLASAYYELSKFSSAVKLFNKVLVFERQQNARFKTNNQLHSDYYEMTSRLNLALSFERLNQLDKAMYHLKAGLRDHQHPLVQPNVALTIDFKTQLATIYVKLEKFNEAIQLFADTLFLHVNGELNRKHFSHSLQQLGKALTVASRYLDSIPVLIDVLLLRSELNPVLDYNSSVLVTKHASLHHNLTEYLWTLFPSNVTIKSENDSEIEYPVELLALLDAECLVELGNSLVFSNRLEEAKMVYLWSVGRFPQHQVAYNNLGVLFYRQENYKQAIEWFEKTLRIEPNHSEAQSALKQFNANGPIVVDVVLQVQANDFPIHSTITNANVRDT